MAEVSPSMSVPPNINYACKYTFFVIHLRQNFGGKWKGFTKGLAKLNARVKVTKTGRDGSEAVCLERNLILKKEVRKWGTMEEAYKKIKDNNHTIIICSV